MYLCLCHGLSCCGHERVAASLRAGRLPCTAFEVGDLLYEIGHGEASEAGIFGAASTFGAVAGAASAHVGLPSAGDDWGHWRMVFGMPIRRKEEIACLRPLKTSRTAGQAMWRIVRRRSLEIRIPRISPSGNRVRL